MILVYGAAICILVLYFTYFIRIEKSKKEKLKTFDNQMTYEDGENSLELFKFYRKITKNDFYLERSFGLVLGMIIMQSYINKLDVFVLFVCLIVVIISLVLSIINGVDSKQKFKNESWFTNDDEELIKVIFIENILQIIAMIIFVILLIVINFSRM